MSLLLPLLVRLGHPNLTQVTAHKRTIGFLDLAAEVRNKIYHYALTARRNDPQKCIWSRLDPYRSWSRWATDEGQTYSFATGLLRVNRQVYHEASSIFYGENGFVLIREPKDVFSHRALVALLPRSIPAIAVTSKASECNRMTMIYQFGHRDIEPINYLEKQIVIAAKDLELFALILAGMSLCEDLPPDIGYSVQATEGSYALSKAAREELLIGLSIFMGPEMALTDELLWQQLPQRPRATRYSYLGFQTLSEKVEAKFADGSFASADIDFEELEEYWARAVNPNKYGWWGHCALPVIKWKQRHAEALRKGGHENEAREVVLSAISRWQAPDT